MALNLNVMITGIVPEIAGAISKKAGTGHELPLPVMKKNRNCEFNC
jgi:hypothetical protein